MAEAKLNQCRVTLGTVTCSPRLYKDADQITTTSAEFLAKVAEQTGLCPTGPGKVSAREARRNRAGDIDSSSWLERFPSQRVAGGAPFPVSPSLFLMLPGIT